VALFATFLVAPVARAEPIATPSFQRTWERTDKPIADGSVTRTWMWGPEAFSASLTEDYAEAPGGQRTVQYFDKSRMEITHPEGDQSSPWYVSNGLLVRELVSGQMQTGDSQFVSRAPAQVNVAGDADDPSGPTYATFTGLQDDPALAEATVIIQRLSRSGQVMVDAYLAARVIKAGQ
jgi:hypothetical protein